MRAGPAASSSPSVPAEAGRRLRVSCYLGTNASDSGKSLHRSLVGVNKGYVIATSDLYIYTGRVDVTRHDIYIYRGGD